MKMKHPRTYHISWSASISSDDKILESLTQFYDKEIVITEKRDGECTSLYNDGYIHARSIDGNSHPWQDIIKSEWRQKCFNLPDGWRIVGENLYAEHSISYINLKTWIEIFAIFDENNIAISWDSMIEWCELLELNPVPILYRGIFDYNFIRYFHKTLDLDKQEGYVMRISDEINYNNWGSEVCKWVRKNHVQTDDEHWSKNWKSNKLMIGDV